MLPASKISQLHALMADNQWDEALRFAAKFPQLGVQAKPITRAADCLKNPGMYVQMGRDIVAIREAGITALREKYLSPPAKPRAKNSAPGRCASQAAPAAQL